MFLMEYGEDWSVSSAYLSEESIRTLSPQAASFIGGVLRFCELFLTLSIQMMHNGFDHRFDHHDGENNVE